MIPMKWKTLESMTHAGFIRSFTDDGIEASLTTSHDFREYGYSDEPIGLKKGTPAQILEHILNKKWKLQSNDKDLVVMWHRFQYVLNSNKKVTGSLFDSQRF